MVHRLRVAVYRFKRVFQKLLEVWREFENWDEIIKSQLSGKTLRGLKCRNGLQISGVNSNSLYIYNEIFKAKVYTPPGYEIMEGDVVVDVGANIGIFTLFASLQSGVKILSYEPHPINYALLRDNALRRSGCNIQCYQLAVAGDTGKRVLHEASIPGGHQLKSSNSTSRDGLSITAVTLNSIMEEHKISEIDFLKLDCEGAEGEILVNSVHCLDKVHRIAMEFHDNTSLLSHEEIAKMLKENGFAVIQKWDGKSPFGYIYARRIGY